MIEQTTKEQLDILVLAARPEGLRKGEFSGADRRQQLARCRELHGRNALKRGLAIGLYHITDHGKKLLRTRTD